MNIAAYGHKFFIFCGALLIAVAILQVLIRPRPQNKTSGLRFIDATIIKAVLFVTVGILAILVVTGTLPMPSGR